MAWRNPDASGKRAATRIVLVDALRCHGLGSTWTLLPPTIVPAAIAFDDVPSGIAELVTTIDESFAGELSPPDLPPPKNAA